MASLSNINGLFDVHSTGAILFSTSHGTSGQILRSNGNAAPTWVAASTVIGGPYLPLTGGTLTGATATATGISFTVGGNLFVTGTSTLTGALSGSTGTFSGLVSGITPTAAANFATKAYVDALTPGAGVFLPLAGGTMTGTIVGPTAGNSSANKAALKVVASGAANEQASIAIQQATSEGDTIIFADYDPYVEYGISTENSANLIQITGGSSTNSLGSKTLYNNAGNARTAYTKFQVSLSSGETLIGGNVGIGVTSPAHKLQVNGDSTVNAGRKFGWVYNPGVDNNMYNYIQTSITPGQSFAAEPLEISGARWTGGNTRSVIFTHQTGGEIMTIMTGGNVGIGTTSPDAKLEVEENTNSGFFSIFAKNPNGGSSAYVSKKWLNDDAGFGEIWRNSSTRSFSGQGASSFNMYNSADINFWSGSNHTMTLVGSNVGIGTTSPDGALQVTAASSTTSNGSDASFKLYLTNTNTTNNNYSLINFTDSDGGASSGGMGLQYTDHTNDYGDLCFITRGSGGYGERMRILSDGKVIIGGYLTTAFISAPTSLLQLQKGYGTSDEPDVVLKISNLSSALTSGTGGSRIIFEADETSNGNGDGVFRHSIESMYGGGVSNWKIYSGPDFDNLYFSTGSSFAMSIDEYQNVGIGTTSPEQKLHVEGTIQLGNTEHLGWAYDNGFYYNWITNSYNSTDGLTYRSGSWTSDQSVICHSFETYAGAWQKRLVIRQDGNVGINDTNPGTKLSVNGANYVEMATFSAATGSTTGIISANSGFVTGFSSSSTHVNSNTAVFSPVVNGIKILKAGLIQVSTNQDFVSTGASSYASVAIYKNSTVMFYSLRTNSNSQWDMLQSSGTMIVAANDVIGF